MIKSLHIYWDKEQKDLSFLLQEKMLKGDLTQKKYQLCLQKLQNSTWKYSTVKGLFIFFIIININSSISISIIRDGCCERFSVAEVSVLAVFTDVHRPF